MLYLCDLIFTFSNIFTIVKTEALAIVHFLEHLLFLVEENK